MKHKLLKGMLAAFMPVLLIICMFPVTAFATEPTYIYVAGTDILNEPNYTMNCGNGTAVYSHESNTLTLNNAEIDSTYGEGDNSKGAITFDGDLNIVLSGDNTITSTSCGIVSRTGGVLNVTGENLHINSAYYGIMLGRGGNSSLDADITMDSASIDVEVNGSGNYAGTGIQAEGTLSVKNQSNIVINASHMALIGNGSISITDSTVNAYAVSPDAYQAVSSDNEIIVDNSAFDIKTLSTYGSFGLWSGNDLQGTVGTINIINNSKVTVKDIMGCSVYCWGSIKVSDSTLEATSTGDWGVWAAQDMLIEGASRVIANGYRGSIGGGNSFILTPNNENLIDVWTGDNAENAVKINGSPIAESTDFSNTKALYFRSEVHAHDYVQKVVSDNYKASEATCTEPAKYYYSCECGEKGTETFSSGEALGHSYKDGKCIVCGAVDPNYEPPTENTTNQTDTTTKTDTTYKNDTPSKDTSTKSPDTGNDSLAVLFAMLAAAGAGAVIVSQCPRKKKYSK